MNKVSTRINKIHQRSKENALEIDIKIYAIKRLALTFHRQ